MKPVFFNGFDPVINNFLASNKLQAIIVFFKFMLRVRNPKKNTGFVNRFLKLNKLDNDFIDDKIEIFYEAGSSFSS